MQSFTVAGMTCAHCTRAVTDAVKAVDPAASVVVDLASGRVDVESAVSPERITQAIEAEGYRVEATARRPA